MKELRGTLCCIVRKILHNLVVWQLSCIMTSVCILAVSKPSDFEFTSSYVIIDELVNRELLSLIAYVGISPGFILSVAAVL